MSFSNIINQKNILLLPFSWLYKIGVFIFHKLYDLKILKSYKPPINTICVGNLSVGGTGKSPMVEYLLLLLKNKYKVAVISRGYRRKTKGFLIADITSTTDDIGDEPMQFHQKFSDVTIAVGEKRADAIQSLLQQKQETDIIILDDAFQHRAVTAGLNILLTDYKNIFTDDWYLPAGSLRDLKSNYKRANIIVVTKCDANLTEAKRTSILRSINPLSHQKVFFTTINYGKPYHIFNENHLNFDDVDKIVLVTGIANPQPILDYIKNINLTVQHLNFPDHHNFSENDIRNILSAYQFINTDNKIILTTEKDAMRLKDKVEFKQLPIYALPVSHCFLFDEGNEFNKLVESHV